MEDGRRSNDLRLLTRSLDSGDMAKFRGVSACTQLAVETSETKPDYGDKEGTITIIISNTVPACVSSAPLDAGTRVAVSNKNTSAGWAGAPNSTSPIRYSTTCQEVVINIVQERSHLHYTSCSSISIT